MIHDAAVVWLRLIPAAIVTVMAGAAVAAVACVGLAVGIRAAARRLWRAYRARGAGRVRIPARDRQRSAQARAGRPLWAHAQPIDYQEAA